ncbi:hypothetical protein Psed_3475 [Pseudonocardia dioxanivorans CB1190]|uniref:Uncharacterized protein n=1 Tax=Pseudonocardia dioxanivorans (strain ATCC 55486 / DSM 44775 / JCM 13855 / CB1190) TaxID=675635 RepID=F4CZC6_PSEUX|nr:hypothetical protein [Pseudonocardia dioxanivorans]AEA25657.1 hypothetical protein Psed_3475 [Pseudonocardia dioxanivorans CB1190]
MTDEELTPTTERDGPVSVFRLEPELIDAVVRGDADRREDVALADAVATVLPWHAELPPEMAGHLTRLIRYFGGDDGLLRWLDEHPGLPRVVARAYHLVKFLDEISGVSAVVTALRELRERNPYPPGLEPYLPPDTDSGSLSSIAQHIESLLGDGRDGDAVALSLATIEMLTAVARRAAQRDPELRGLGEYVEQLRREIEGARAPG